MGVGIGEGRAASKKSSLKIWLVSFYFLARSFRKNSAVENISPKTEGADKLVTAQIWKLKTVMSLFSDVFSFSLHFKYYAIFES
jgi:hypothetical protein